MDDARLITQLMTMTRGSKPERKAAAAWIEALMRGDPDNPRHIAAAGMLAWADGRYADAIGLFGRLAASSDDEVFSFLLATLQCSDGQVREALGWIERGLAQAGGESPFFECRAGQLYVAMLIEAWRLEDQSWPFDPARLRDEALPLMSEACRDVASRLLETGHAEGEPSRFGGEIPEDDGRVLFNLARMVKPRRILEVGFAKGLSTIHLMAGAGAALERHTVIDPTQDYGYSYNGMRNVTAAGFADKLRLIEMPSQFALPKLMATGASFDLIFIDSAHSFDATFIEAWYATMLSRPGTVLAFHDRGMAPVAAVLDYLRTNLGYRMMVAGEVAILLRVEAIPTHEHNYVPFQT
ncbi:MAG: class I SAM-dependent methyltransferase [Alphaproteobacteria bacterium]|nr:class I SAM-dependent methyltransferase [Alphaproteobacteria bacterium]